MPLDLKDFTIPEQSFAGLYKVSDDLEKERERKEAKAKLDRANQASMSKFLLDYADPKDQLSGSPYDPYVTQGFGAILQDGMKLIKENPGLTQDMLLTALQPKVSKLSTYAQTAKVLKDNVEKALVNIPENSGYDKNKLRAEAVKNAWMDENGQLKDISTIDVTSNPVANVVRDRPDAVTNNKGIDEWMKGLERTTNNHEIKTTNSKGGSQRLKVKTIAPAGWVPDTDENGVANRKFVPPYQLATDGGEPIIHEFDDGKGGKTKAQVRLLDDKTFNSLMANSTGTADWIRGQVMQHLKEYKDADGNPIDINSPQARNVGRAIAYDELKSRNAGSMEDITETKANPAPKISIKIDNGKKGDDININDIYGRITGKFDDVTKEKGEGSVLLMNTLDSDELETVLTAANKIYKPLEGEKGLDYTNTFIAKDKNGQLALYKTGEDGKKYINKENRVMTIPRVGTNLKAQPSVKEKRKVIAIGNDGNEVKTTKEKISW